MKLQYSSNKLHYWFAVIIATYAIAGHFIGKEFSPVTGFLTTPLGLLTGYLVAKRTENKSNTSRVTATILPLLVLALVLRFEHKVYTLNVLSGAWIARANNTKFTLIVENNSALLSAEPGLKNVWYQAEVKDDSLLLTAAEDNRLAWHITSRIKNQLILDAGGGLLFTKVQY